MKTKPFLLFTLLIIVTSIKDTDFNINLEYQGNKIIIHKKDQCLL
jgi:hypothetical protein